MNVSLKSLFACGTSALCLAFGAAAQSVDYSSLQQTFGEPVTTSATGKPQRASEVPADMVIVTQDQIRRSGANAILVMDGVSGSAAADATKSKKIPCFTGDSALVKSGACLISIKTDPKVEILVNGALSKSSGVGFGAAFRMMITEI